MSVRESRGGSRGTAAAVAVLVLAVVIWSLAWWYPRWAYGAPESAGEFGDMFGAGNSLFSALALGFVIVTLWMQRDELAQQREQMERSADAQQRSEIAFRQQVRALLLGAQLQSTTSLIELYSEKGPATNTAFESLGVTSYQPLMEKLDTMLKEAEDCMRRFPRRIPCGRRSPPIE